MTSKLAVGTCWIVWAAWSASACGGVSAGSACPTDDLAGFTCEQQLSVEQSQCTGDADGATLTPNVHWSTDGKALLVTASRFRCDQTVCAYLDASSPNAQVLLQPCDMTPSTALRCSCGYSLSVPVALPASSMSVTVEVRSDSTGGAQPAHIIETLSVGAAAKLCDGTSALRFASTSGGGNLTGIPKIVSELGWSFLLVDGSCRYYAMNAPDQEIRSGALSDTEAASFSRDFLLGGWSELDQPVSGCADAGTDAFAFGADRARSSCSNTALTTAKYAWLPRLYDAGSPMSGAVRYAVTAASNEQWPESKPSLALPYPLSNPSSIVSEPDADTQVQVAKGADADTLRALRAQYQTIPGAALGPAYGVPIVVAGDSEPRYFDLTLRDTVPFEKDGALAIEAFIQ